MKLPIASFAAASLLFSSAGHAADTAATPKPSASVTMQGTLSPTDLQIIARALQLAAHTCGDSDQDVSACQIGYVAPGIRKELADFKPVDAKK